MKTIFRFFSNKNVVTILVLEFIACIFIDTFEYTFGFYTGCILAIVYNLLSKIEDKDRKIDLLEREKLDLLTKIKK